MAHPAVKLITIAEYLDMEEQSATKHEFIEGEVVAMAGASLAHNYIIANLLKEAGVHLDGGNCDVFPSDLKVTTPFSTSYLYPDVTIVCGKPELDENSPDTITNPAVIIEVMSPSTQKNDRGYKFFTYMQIPSLKEYILISSTGMEVEHMRKQPDNAWQITNATGPTGELYIQCIEMRLPFKSLYNKVSF
ncbi:MAG: Uma2 family endonuclease [Taibaiella sp.]|nr:Uma2 family endonuclease [Taibaiella sp.]